MLKAYTRIKANMDLQSANVGSSTNDFEQVASGEIRPDSEGRAIEEATNEAEEQIIKDVLADMQDSTGELNSI